jgi:hypothetical protein
MFPFYRKARPTYTCSSPFLGPGLENIIKDAFESDRVCRGVGGAPLDDVVAHATYFFYQGQVTPLLPNIMSLIIFSTVIQRIRQRGGSQRHARGSSGTVGVGVIPRC